MKDYDLLYRLIELLDIQMEIFLLVLIYGYAFHDFSSTSTEFPPFANIFRAHSGNRLLRLGTRSKAQTLKDTKFDG